MKRKIINKNNRRPVNLYDKGSLLKKGFQKLGEIDSFASAALGVDSLAQGSSQFVAKTFGGDAYKNNPDFINEGIYGDRSGTNFLRQWTTNDTLGNTIDKIENYGSEGFKGDTLDSLSQEYQNTDFLEKSNISKDALLVSDVTDFFLNPLSFSFSTLFGGRKSAAERQDEINEAIEKANQRKMADFDNRVQQIQNRQKNLDMQNMFSFGGPFDSYIGGAIDYDLAQKNLENKRIDALSKNKITALPATGSVESINMFAGGGGLSRSKDYGSKKKPYPSVKKGDFAGGGRSYPIPTKADAVDALRLAGLHNRPDVKAKVYKKYPSLKKHAFGGDLNSNGSIFDLGYTNIDNGDTHENNIYGGVPVGVDSQGIPNLVEEGEVIWNDYVFSDRLKNPKTGRTFAKDAKRAQKESEERPNDAISKRGREAAFTKLAEAQEAIRQKEASKKQSKNYFALGGWDTDDPFGVGKFEFTPSFDKSYDADWSTYNPDKIWDTMREMSIIPGIYNMINPPKAYSYNVPKSRDVSYTPLGDMLVYTPFNTDYRTSQLQADAAATRRALRNSGNPMSNAAILAADYDSQLALGNLARQAAEFNLAQRQDIARFNRDTRSTNATNALKAATANQAKDLQEAGLEIEAQKYYQDKLDKLYASRLGALENIMGNIAQIGKDRRNRYDALWSAKYLPGGQTIKTT